MAPVTLPPGFRFHPTDEELVTYYLARKINAQEMELDIIPVVDLYKCEPWELPVKSLLPSKDMEWYFFCSRDRKYPNGSRTNRATTGGYWKATGKDRMVQSNKQAVGMKKTLVYYKGRAPHGTRTGWVMHEYRVIDSVSDAIPALKDIYALCRIFKKYICKPETSASQSGTLKDVMPWIPNDFIGGDGMSGYINEEETREVNYVKDNVKFPSDSSSSEITHEIPMDGGVNAGDAKAPSPMDEGNSLREACRRNVDADGLLEDKIFDSKCLQNQLHYPPLEVDDFPQIGLIETRLTESHTIDDYRMYAKYYSSINEKYSIDDFFYMVSI